MIKLAPNINNLPQLVWNQNGPMGSPEGHLNGLVGFWNGHVDSPDGPVLPSRKNPKLFIQKIYSFKKNLKLFIQRFYSFKKKSEIIHSKNLFIQENPKLFIQKKYSFKWKTDYRPWLKGTQFLAKRGPKGDPFWRKRGPKIRFFQNCSQRANMLK